MTSPLSSIQSPRGRSRTVRGLLIDTETMQRGNAASKSAWAFLTSASFVRNSARAGVQDRKYSARRFFAFSSRLAGSV